MEIGVYVDVAAKKKREKARNSRRRRIIREIIKEVDELISDHSGGTVDRINWYTFRAVMDLIQLSLEHKYISPTLYEQKNSGVFDKKIYEIINGIIRKNEINTFDVSLWIIGEVAKNFIKRTFVLLDERLEEHDWADRPD